MHILLPREKLLEHVGIVSRVVMHNAHIPALQGVRCIVSGDVCTLVGTNIEMSVTVDVDGKDGVDGSCVIPARILLEVLKNTRGETVSLTEKDGVLVVKNPHMKGTAGSTKITLLPQEDFPKNPTHISEVTFSLPASVFATGFAHTLFAVSPSTIKPELACVSVSEKDGTVLFVATDSFRLAEKKVPYIGEEQLPTLLIPGKNAHELLFFLSTMGEKDVLWYFDEGMCALRVGAYYVTSRLVQGTFPDYTRILPKETTTTATFLLQDLQYVFKKASLFSDVTRQLGLELVPEKNECLFRSKNATVGEFEESLPCKITGVSLGLSFNSKYISECLQYMKEESIECSFAGSGKPLVIRGVHNDSFLYLVMPMNR